jgi:hypothetical protein
MYGYWAAGGIDSHDEGATDHPETETPAVSYPSIILPWTSSSGEGTCAFQRAVISKEKSLNKRARKQISISP